MRWLALLLVPVSLILWVLADPDERQVIRTTYDCLSEVFDEETPHSPIPHEAEGVELLPRCE
jgi:hypothetical protein